MNGNVEGAARLVERGAPLTLATALCLERWTDAERLAAATAPHDRRFALTLTALKGKTEAVRRLIATGDVDVNAVSPDLYSHATPVHHAVSAGSLATVQVLAEAGAQLDARDTAYDGTPPDWAMHLGKRSPFSETAAYLRSRGAS